MATKETLTAEYNAVIARCAAIPAEVLAWYRSLPKEKGLTYDLVKATPQTQRGLNACKDVIEYEMDPTENWFAVTSKNGDVPKWILEA